MEGQRVARDAIDVTFLVCEHVVEQHDANYRTGTEEEGDKKTDDGGQVGVLCTEDRSRDSIASISPFVLARRWGRRSGC